MKEKPYIKKAGIGKPKVDVVVPKNKAQVSELSRIAKNPFKNPKYLAKRKKTKK